MIVLQNIQKSYGQKVVLTDISHTIADGTFLAITGPSGSGKTTLLHLMGLLETANGGTVTIDGQTGLKGKDKKLFYRYKAGFLFQNFALLEDKSVKENMEIALAYRKISSKKQAISEALERVQLSGIERKKVYELSGGEQQRVALARLLLKDPQYLFADEPTGNLDEHNRDIIFNHLIRLNEQGKTIIFVTHDKELVAKAKDVITL